MTRIHTHEPGEHESAYDGLLVDDAHWAFGAADPGTGLGIGDDPLEGVDTAVPDGVVPAALAAYSLMLGDDALVLSQRLSEWCSNAPDLEEDIALANIALDLLGQARLLLARAAAADPAIVPTLPEGATARPEDRLAFFRDAPAFRNVRMAEAPRGDFAETVARLLLMSAWRLALLQRLTASRDPVLSAVAAKGVKELAYHRDFAGRWFVTLARGTEESRRRLVAALDGLWPLWPELFASHPVETELAASQVGVDPASVAGEVDEVLAQVLAASGLQRARPGLRAGGAPEGRAGRHTHALEVLLAQMQSVARAHPLGEW